MFFQNKLEFFTFGQFWGPLGHLRYSWGSTWTWRAPIGAKLHLSVPPVFSFTTSSLGSTSGIWITPEGSPMRTKILKNWKNIIHNFFKIFPTIYFLSKLMVFRGPLGIIKHSPNPWNIFSELTQLKGAVTYDYPWQLLTSDDSNFWTSKATRPWKLSDCSFFKGLFNRYKHFKFR